MKKRDLKFLFEATFHNKVSFDEFKYIILDKEYKIYYPHSGKSEIFNPSKKLKEFQRFLNIYLFEFLPLNENCVFSYRKGFGVIDAVKIHRESKYFFQTDISSFFNSINSEMVRETIIRGKERCPIEDIDKYLDLIVDMVCVGGRLPIGFPSSSPLSNAVLYDFDKSLEEFCKNSGIFYSRYADDIVVSSLYKDSLQSVEKFVELELKRYFSNSFKINEKKTKYYNSGGDVTILGVSILPNGVLTIEKKIRNEIEMGIFYYLKDRSKFKEFILRNVEDQVKRDVDDYDLDRLSGLLNYANSINDLYIDKLRKKFGVTIIDTLIHRSRAS